MDSIAQLLRMNAPNEADATSPVVNEHEPDSAAGAEDSDVESTPQGSAYDLIARREA